MGTKAIGKMPVMIFGTLSYVAIAAVILIFSTSTLSSWKWGLVFLFILGGNGRAVFEGTNKATVADFFPDKQPAAFANVIITSGGASSIAFFVFPFMTGTA